MANLKLAELSRNDRNTLESWLVAFDTAWQQDALATWVTDKLPGPDSPLIITTNFALTYFVVSAEVESSRVPTWLLIMDTDGLSVLTAWSAGKFVADAMAPFVKKIGIEEKIGHKKIIIPGYVAQLSGEFQEELGGNWEVVIGPREAADLPRFLKAYK